MNQKMRKKIQKTTKKMKKMIQQRKTTINLKARRKRNSSIDSNRINLMKKSRMMKNLRMMKTLMNPKIILKKNPKKIATNLKVRRRKRTSSAS
ncbi:hypothetical protein HMPREF2951_04405 [Staphylococcus sp. HMSC056D08]|nr:hypothetical protein HMPREF2951_04405 [Staphylococcus sp. HMSC056D08]